MKQKIKDEVVRVIENAAHQVGQRRWDEDDNPVSESWELYEKIEALTVLQKIVGMVLDGDLD